MLQFAFDLNDTGAANDYLPHNYSRNCVVYTGTHDNETIAGWFAGLSDAEKKLVRDYLCSDDTPDGDMYRVLVSAAMRSCAATCIIPIQDYLGLDNSCRMNQPSTVGENWRWRLKADALTPELAERLLDMVKTYGRYTAE